MVETTCPLGAQHGDQLLNNTTVGGVVLAAEVYQLVRFFWTQNSVPPQEGTNLVHIEAID